MSLNDNLRDAVREMEKALAVLEHCDQYFQNQAAMNAQLHLSDRIIPNPLAAAVATEVQQLGRSIKGFQRVLYGEVSLDLGWEE